MYTQLCRVSWESRHVSIVYTHASLTHTPSVCVEVSEGDGVYGARVLVSLYILYAGNT